MKNFHHVTITVFFREEDQEFINQLFPIPLSEFLAAQFKHDSDQEHTKIYALKKAKLSITENYESTLKVFKFFFEKQSDTNKIFEKIISSISQEQREQLVKDAMKHVDEDGNFFLRLDKLALEENKFVLTTGGNCVHFAFSIAAYPKNEKTIQEVVQRLF